MAPRPDTQADDRVRRRAARCEHGRGVRSGRWVHRPGRRQRQLPQHGAARPTERARDTSEEDYKAGQMPLTDVLDADRELLTAQDDLARTRAAAPRAAVRAFGGGR